MCSKGNKINHVKNLCMYSVGYADLDSFLLAEHEVKQIPCSFKLNSAVFKTKVIEV